MITFKPNSYLERKWKDYPPYFRTQLIEIWSNMNLLPRNLQRQYTHEKYSDLPKQVKIDLQKAIPELYRAEIKSKLMQATLKTTFTTTKTKYSLPFSKK